MPPSAPRTGASTPSYEKRRFKTSMPTSAIRGRSFPWTIA
jgi:hypothetical protein